jgi:cytidylate kinase
MEEDAMASIDTIINRQLLIWEGTRERAARKPKEPEPPPPIISVSRQAGSRGAYFAQRLSEELGYQRMHREIIEAISKSSGFRKRILESIDEHVRGDLELAFESVFTGQSVDHSDFVRHLVRVVLSMAELGGVVVVGRGANFILGPNRGVHIRVVCPVERRILNLIKYRKYSEKEAAAFVKRTDSERRDFVRKTFGRDIDDPLGYDVIFNSALIDIEEMVDAAKVVIKTKMDKLTHLYFEDHQD